MPYTLQSRQSIRLFLQSSKLKPPPPHTLPNPLIRRRVCPPPFGSGGGHTSLREGGGVQIPFRRGVRHCGTLGIYVVCALPTKTVPPSKLHKTRALPLLPPKSWGSICPSPSKARCQSFKRCLLLCKPLSVSIPSITYPLQRAMLLFPSSPCPANFMHML
jgi:hypothetical protein